MAENLKILSDDASKEEKYRNLLTQITLFVEFTTVLNNILTSLIILEIFYLCGILKID
jgi:hypothetical protein